MPPKEIPQPETPNNDLGNEALILSHQKTHDTLGNLEKLSEVSALNSEKQIEEIKGQNKILDMILQTTFDMAQKMDEKKGPTEVKLVGPEIQVMKGETGDKGDIGDKGDTGPQGEQGMKGEKGEDGIQGAQGERGEQGMKGDTGPQGIRGETGKTGATGPKGEAGQNGKNGSPDTGEDIVAKLRSLEQSARLSWKDLKDTPDFVPRNDHKGSGGGYLRELSDVAIGNTDPTHGYVLSWNATIKRWVPTAVASGGGTWGSITGTLSNQIDLQAALDAKQNTIPTGTTAQYFRGDFSLATFPTAVSSFTNDAGYITASSANNLTNKTGLISQWTNDAGYITSTGITPAALTRVDDTNVTLTLGGSPATALLQATSITVGWAGTLAVTRGGSGAGTLTGYLKGNGTSAFTAVSSIPASDISSGASLTRVDDTNVTLTLGGSPTTSLLAATSLTLGWAGTLSVPRGGSGAGTLTGYLKGNGASAFTASATIPASDISSGAALTRTDDTNVTITLGGSPTSALLAATSITVGWTGTLADARITSAATWNAKIGGSGTTNEIAYFTASGTIASLAVATYPSLTELSYVKGVTSPIQAQIDAVGAMAGGSKLYLFYHY